MTLHLHRAERADRLVGALGALLSTPLPDPFSTEIVCVPTPGVERWLSQELSRQLGSSVGRSDGVCAGIEFGSPRRLVARILSSVLPGASDVDPWQPQRSVWPLLARDRRLPRGAVGGVAVVLSRRARLRGRIPVRGGRRWSTARHLADLFARYGATRPAMIDNWRRGLDVDADGRPLPADRAWQAELWRRLRDELAVPSPAEQIAAAESALLAGTAQLRPARAAVGVRRDQARSASAPGARRARRPSATSTCGCRTPPPCSGQRLADQLHDLRAGASGGPTTAPRTLVRASAAGLSRPRLPRAAAGPRRAVGDGAVVDQHHPDPPPDAVPAAGPCSARLQADLAAEPAAGRRRTTAASSSATTAASSCTPRHGPDRQVEVLRELLVGLLADDPTLEPRDIVVMCPDIETFAPLIAAAFGLDTADAEAEHPGHRLRVRLADRSLRQLNPLLAAVGRLVGLAESRMEASALLDLCATAPVAPQVRLQHRRSGTAARPRRASPACAGGSTPTHRARYGMAAFGQNTWAAGLDRLLLGVAMDETDQHFIGTALPMDDVDSSDVDLIGRLAECVDRIRAVTDACRRCASRSAAGWSCSSRRSSCSPRCRPPTAGSSATRTPSSAGWPTTRTSAEAADLELGWPRCPRCWRRPSAGGRPGPTSGPAP